MEEDIMSRRTKVKVDEIVSRLNDKIEIGKKYSSRNKIVDVLDLPETYKRGNSSKRFQRILDKYTKYTKPNKFAFIFSNISNYNTVTNMSYKSITKLLSLSIIFDLVGNYNNAEKNNGQYCYYIKKDDWFLRLKAYNKIYSKHKYNPKSIIFEEDVVFDNSIDEYTAKDFFNTTNAKLNMNLNHSLSQLESMGLIEVDRLYEMKYHPIKPIPTDDYNAFDESSILKLLELDYNEDDIIDEWAIQEQQKTFLTSNIKNNKIIIEDLKSLFISTREEVLLKYCDKFNIEYNKDTALFAINSKFNDNNSKNDIYREIYNKMEERIKKRYNKRMQIVSIARLIKVSYKINRLSELHNELENHDLNCVEAKNKLNKLISEQLIKNAKSRKDKLKNNINNTSRYNNCRIKDRYIDKIQELVEKTIKYN